MNDKECERIDRNKQCKYKRKHNTIEEAKKHLFEQKSRSPWGEFSIYKCGWCHKWHIGNDKIKHKLRVLGYYKYINKR